MPTELTWPKAIEKVLSESSTPLHYIEIAARIIAGGLRQSFGATPAATVSATLTVAIMKNGSSSPFVRVDRGIFTTAKGFIKPAFQKQQKLTPNVVESDETEAQYEIVSSFGMFWRREAVEWVATPRLLGMQQIGATPVDFNKQLGIYLLYDGREVIYVGRSTDRPLGKRLFEHTCDRLSSRWDRFSWFGLLPVSGQGKLGPLPKTFDAAKLIPALEAILIEALEPRQNRKRGDDLAAVEFIQRIDPEIEKKRIQATVAAAINKL